MLATPLTWSTCRRQPAPVTAGEWTAQEDFCFWMFPLIELAHVFGMRVVAHDLVTDNAPEWEDFAFLEVSELLRTSDVVPLNCSLTPENEGMINADALSVMKPTSILINCSRGPLVVAADLAQALNSGTIAAAGLDVLPEEPPADDGFLFTAKNCTITPHMAWATRSARNRLLNTAVENMRAFLAGAPQNVANEVG